MTASWKPPMMYGRDSPKTFIGFNLTESVVENNWRTRNKILGVSYENNYTNCLLWPGSSDPGIPRSGIRTCGVPCDRAARDARV